MHLRCNIDSVESLIDLDTFSAKDRLARPKFLFHPSKVTLNLCQARLSTWDDPKS
jgi:hypothetical protein